MSRDKGLEELVHGELQAIHGVTGKAMFGGWAWLINGNMFCGSRDDGLLVRLGKGRDDWALGINGIEPMISRGKPMSGWVRCDASAFGEDDLRKQLISSAIDFVLTLPGK